MKLKELEQIINQLAGDHQKLVERVNDLEKKLVAPIGVNVTEEDMRRMAKAWKDHYRDFCGSQ